MSAALRSTLTLLFAFFGTVGGWIVASDVAAFYHVLGDSAVLLNEMAFVCLGCLLGVLLAIPLSYILEISITRIIRQLEALTLPQTVVGTAGLITGLVVSFLFSLLIVAMPLPELQRDLHIPSGISVYVAPLLILMQATFWSVLGAFLGARLGDLPEVTRIFGSLVPATSTVGSGSTKILDTSAIIDGRIADVCKAGFVDGALVIPSFVLGELQRLADSADGLKRARGRRGLEMLDLLRKDYQVEVRDCPTTGPLEVDAHLVRMAQDLPGQLVTTDYNLNKVASVRGIKVLNLNELAHALRPAVLPGEALTVKVVRDGKERGQGVGYLDDGTMIVVEEGQPHIGKDVSVEVTGIRQTVAGKMIFARARMRLGGSPT